MILTGVGAQDITAPARPYIEYVTVDTSNNNTIISWSKSSSDDVMWYYLYYEVFTPNGSEGFRFDSVSADISIYTHVNSGAESGVILYSVTASDSAGNESLRTPGLHNTILCRQEYDSCNNIMKLSWNKYIGWENKLSGYIIHWRTDAGNFSVLSGAGPNDSTFVHYNVQANTNYYYLIEAVKNDGLKSLSPISLRYTYVPGPARDLILDYVSIPSHNLAEISFHFTDTSYIRGFSLLRSSNPDADFLNIKEIYDLTTDSYTFYDSILTKVNQFYYKIGNLNTCGKVIKESNLGSTILLSGENQDETNIIRWNAYRDFASGLQEYRLFRNDINNQPVQIATIPPGSESYIDNLSSVYNSGISGDVKYILKAAGSAGEISSSDTLVIKLSTLLHMPNAFTPNGDGRNDSFKPILSFIPGNYQMIVYDRYGVQIFETKDPFSGWDGSISGKGMAEEGVYVYHIQFTSFTGTSVLQTGKVLVIYP